MIDDLIRIIRDKFLNFGLYTTYRGGTDTYVSYNIYLWGIHDKHLGVIYFYNHKLYYYHDISTPAIDIDYSDLDIDILAGIFLCRLYCSN